MNRYQFPEGFFWGAAASGPQTEGFANKPHRSIWDSWYAEQPNRFFQQIGPQKVCETYSKYKEDVALMKQTGFNSFRTSIQWSRLIDDFETGTPNAEAVRFYNNYCDEDKKAAWYADLFFNRSFLEPLVKHEFPKELCEVLATHDCLPEIKKADVDLITSSRVDFLGVNYYVPRRVKARECPYELDYFTPEYYFENYSDPEGRFNPYRDNNEIFPQAIYDIASNIRDNYDNMKWYLAEIGIAMDIQSEGPVLADGVIDDTFRIELMEEHLEQLHRAISEGANCFGVHQWTFIDNWSWINSFKRRYGFWRLDLESGERQIKRNALWFAELAASNGFTPGAFIKGNK
ncbi:6-phospho-beta-glucosidase [Klebsiella aerogenes]|uniref:glycoside hydrolase family 1 protein n=1 Tax=Klebsiella aerogenes TaxID=548 RepID=UPI00063CBD3E|nr:family 1 glycosylhydrolase [Klebsiella aerogenes]KLE63675.1 6-phospho-beta-glucosidase [Klebsiella aerogenes]